MGLEEVALMPWIDKAAKVLLKTSLHWPEACCLCLRFFWDLRAQIFHAIQVLDKGARPSQLRQSFGKLLKDDG